MTYWVLMPACFLRSAQRRFIASAIRRLPSGVSLRFLGAETDLRLSWPRFGVASAAKVGSEPAEAVKSLRRFLLKSL